MQEKNDTASNDLHRYDEIINLPHWEPRKRMRMPREKRAAQFMPFKALTPMEELEKENERRARLSEEERSAEDQHEKKEQLMQEYRKLKLEMQKKLSVLHDKYRRYNHGRGLSDSDAVPMEIQELQQQYQEEMAEIEKRYKELEE